jgi:hypothetical protein
MIQRQHQDFGIGDGERAFDKIDVFARARQLRHVDREIRIGHHPGKRIHHKVRVTPSREIKSEMVFRVI